MKNKFDSKTIDFTSKNKNLKDNKNTLRESMTVDQYSGKKIIEEKNEHKVVEFKKAKKRQKVNNYKKKISSYKDKPRKKYITNIYIILLIIIFLLFISKFI